MASKYGIKGSFSSDCHCTIYDEETGNEKQSDECFGDCFMFDLDWFIENTIHFFKTKPTVYYVYDFPTWRGPRDGEITAKNADDFIRRFLSGCGNDYNVTWEAKYREIKIRVGHHDGSGVVTISKKKGR
jgi:hypothetical protein